MPQTIESHFKAIASGDSLAREVKILDDEATVVGFGQVGNQLVGSLDDIDLIVGGDGECAEVLGFAGSAEVDFGVGLPQIIIIIRCFREDIETRVLGRIDGNPVTGSFGSGKINLNRRRFTGNGFVLGGDVQDYLGHPALNGKTKQAYSAGEIESVVVSVLLGTCGSGNHCIRVDGCPVGNGLDRRNDRRIKSVACRFKGEHGLKGSEALGYLTGKLGHACIGAGFVKSKLTLGGTVVHGEFVAGLPGPSGFNHVRLGAFKAGGNGKGNQIDNSLLSLLYGSFDLKFLGCARIKHGSAEGCKYE